jgi:hypothetical protein
VVEKGNSDAMLYNESSLEKVCWHGAGVEYKDKACKVTISGLICIKSGNEHKEGWEFMQQL